MNVTRTHINSVLRWIPPIGISCFILLYIYAASLYPGGSQADLNSVGFDWVHNYWCNLINTEAMNGQLNPARPFGIVALFILCLSSMVFFWRFAGQFAQNPFWKKAIKIGGTVSMGLACFMFTDYHDLITILSSIAGLFVVIGIIWEIYRSPRHFYKITGLLCLVLLGLNNYVYYTKDFIEILPLLQKITFLLVLVWVIGLNGAVSRLKA